MFTHFIVPLDGSPESAIAVTQACVIARLTGAGITLLRVYSGGSPTPESVEYLHTVALECGELSERIDVAVLAGRPDDVILEQVGERRADLIIMRTRGRSGLSRAVLGSVTESIVKHSPTPVLLLPPHAAAATSVRTILVPVDGSPGGALALGVAREMALVTRARLHLLQIIVPAAAYLGNVFAGQGPIYVDPLWDEDAESGARAYVDSLTRRLSDEGLQCDAEVLIADSVPDTIVRRATEQADLIAMSSEAHTGAARALLGSVADQVVRQAARPVLVVRRAAEPAARPS
jgi:nucleotide-binding universal stress UspA family protein